MKPYERYERAKLELMERRAAEGWESVQLSPEEKAQLQAENITTWDKLLALPARASVLLKPVAQLVPVKLYEYLDLSHWNPVDSYDAIAGYGITGLIVKATEGLTYKDPMRQAHYDGGKSAGMAVGFYHFARPEYSQYTEARHFVTTVKEVTGGEIPIIGYREDGTPIPGLALDFEVTGGLDGARLNTWVWGFVSEVHTLTGYWPVIYTSPYIWSLVTGDKTRFAVCPLWIANWNVPVPIIPAPWESYTYWQDTVLPKGSIPGIPGQVDHNYSPFTWVETTTPPPDPDPDPEPEPVEPGAGLSAVTTTQPWLNLRAGPSLLAEDIGDLLPGTQVTISDIAAPVEAWVYVTTEDGRAGWAAIVWRGKNKMEIVQ